MPFLRGSLGFERFSVAGFESSSFDDEHIEILTNNAAGRNESASTENVHVGYLGGAHLFDQDFDTSKNVINEAVHCSVRIDTNQIPAAIREAWLQMELTGYAKDSPSGKPTKAQRKEAKEAVEQRCEVEAASGKYRRMQQFPLLWDHGNSTLYFGGSVGTSSAFCIDLLERTFEVEMRRISAGIIAQQWAIDADRFADLDDLHPAAFVDTHTHASLPWANEHSQAPDFLGNEFLLWLWWTLENESDTIDLADETEVCAMFAKTLTLECPLGESGKETITSECPVKLPEAMQAVRSGKLPRKAGLTIVREGRTFDLVLQAETFAISGAKIHLDEDEEFEDDDRIDAIRTLSETVDLLFHAFCDRRSDAEAWNKDLSQMKQWLNDSEPVAQKAAA
ncbi:hypothetical protein K227x_30180 [Rubripirellula lacrimiformis]|uniref:Recombination-associated protein RdgC n=1 Tax=Rubripirellula lacrimiformis TaxID=1930273 RepID=A0A517NBW0_9BACT|nr:hypothetical protein [Rubripirellula lacrimiformis]QDT04625.1 hypothetical protein K227x_30180 [Rubripirellula lacrimiformis]